MKNQKTMTTDSKMKCNFYFKLILITVFFITRLINLDADIPFGWGFARYQHFDEVFYSIPALHLFHYGTWAVEYFGFKFNIAGGWISIPIWNYLHFIFLEIFENKLIAIRFPAVLAGAGIYILYLNILSRLNNDFKKSGTTAPILFILFAVYPLCDLIFYLSNTINEPTIYRLLFASWLFYILVGSDVISKKKAFWIGVLAAFSVVFVYLYNLFLLLFAFLVLLQKPHRHKLLYFFSGGAVVVLIWIGSYEWLHNVSLLQAFSALVASGSRGVNSLSPIDIVIRIALLFSTNFLSVSPALLVFFFFGLLGLPMLTIDFKQESMVNKALKLCWIFLSSYILQSIFMSDFIFRKGLIIYLPVLILSYIFLTTIISNSAIKMRSGVLFSVMMLVLGSGLLIYVFLLAKMLESHGYYQTSDWFGISRNSYFIIGSVFIVSVLALVTLQKRTLKKWVAPLILTVTIIFNAHLIVIHKFINSHHSFSETIADIGNLTPGYFIGNLSYSFTLGNKQNKPFLILYKAKAMKVPDWNLSINDLNVLVFDKFIANVQDPIYTVVQGGEERDRLLKHYSNAKVVYSNLKYSDVETYYDYRVSKLSKSENNEIYVIQLNPYSITKS
jgi:hypothetical protein